VETVAELDPVRSPDAAHTDCCGFNGALPSYDRGRKPWQLIPGANDLENLLEISRSSRGASIR
jgi:hypothetical protein